MSNIRSFDMPALEPPPREVIDLTREVIDLTEEEEPRRSSRKRKRRDLGPMLPSALVDLRTKSLRSERGWHLLRWHLLPW